MKIALIGGTGSIGKGFALRWGQKHQVIVGSRNQEKAQAKATEYNCILKDHGFKANITGEVNAQAASEADVVLLAIRYGQIASTIEQIRPGLSGKVIISVVVPMEKNSCIIVPGEAPLEISAESREDYKTDYFCYVTPPSGSAAQEIAALLPEGADELVSAFHTVPAAKLSNLDVELDYDIGVCGNSMRSKSIVFDLVRDIPGMRPMDIGPLETSSMVESITPLLVNVAIRNNMKDVSIKFVD
ncbi:MAG: 8-hydroxy-5-deazaflavin:NADPH oxidoreductase [Methanomethylovorans sp. PtaU1.Bin093]|jgi:predicted dinucleotide-binding enzyme|uniref:NAD(P)-binding domain-containing protein n=1 Tax=Methanomethylovorans sp. PtaU1.Bin093 TaxID=1811679 RepID=UPI0009C63AEA|nr:NAD(P)-binding domain-containing protein [Methanomethylovorans sp. PtaU1.Bin093]OPY19483.1 MAG: 8-hydroxy-5-deazaflavin:NADPH oxidoreductase [Methanomethylovorans sp. PtaU1.Bin093]